MNIEKFLDITGLDLIPYALGLSEFRSNTPFEPTKLTEIRKKIDSLKDKKLEESLEYSKELLDEELTRGEKAESKAYNLIGVAGISAAFITGISSLFPEESEMISIFSLTTVLIFYSVIVISLTLTVLLASRAVAVRGYARPDMADIFSMNSKSITDAKKDRLTAYMYSYAKNTQTHNIKISYLIGAQIWFRNSIIFFLALAFALVFIFIDIAPNPTSTMVVPTQTQITFTSIAETQSITSTNSPTASVTPKPTNKSVDTETPTATNTSP